MALHLENKETNERAQLIELRGVVADDLKGALREMEAVASGTRSKRPLYHASINTDPTEHLTSEQQATAIDRLEAALGLTGQPRAVVEHEKAGRAHVHVVWSRIDLEHMRAISDSHNYRTHEEVARGLEQEFGHQRVQGAHIGRDGAERPERTPSHAEMQQAERTKVTPKQAKELITAILQRTDNGKAVAAALEQEGWILARGDGRDFVALDPRGGTHSLARRVDGAKAKDVRERMADLDPTTLPSVDQAREQQRARQVAREEMRDAAMPAPPLAAAPEPQQIPQEVGQGLPDTRPPEIRQETQPEIPAAAAQEPETIARTSIIVEPILEPDLSRGTTATTGNVTVEETAAPTAPAAEVSEFVARGDAHGMQAADQDSRSVEATTDNDAPASIESSSVEAPPIEDFNFVGGLERGAGVVLDAGAKLVEGVMGFLDGLIGGGSAKPARAQTAESPPAPAMSVKERRAAKRQAFLDADQQQRQAARQETARSIGASEALTDDELRHEKELQEKRHQDRFIENSR